MISNKPNKKQKLRNIEYYDMQIIFDDLYSKSDKNIKFSNLMDIIISIENVLLAYRNIKSNTGSKTQGVDGQVISDLNKLSSDNLVNMVRKKLRNYIPQRVRRVEIPKGDTGKTRPLGIPTISDRLIQQCILQVLEPICEAKFSNNSNGFRPNRSCESAIALAMQCMQHRNLHFCVDIDIKGFFDNVNHGKLLKQIWTLGIQDKNLICVFSKILKSEIVMPNGDIIKPTKGTPQGGIISPLLSNIVLNELDHWIGNQWVDKEMREIKPIFNKKGHRHKGTDYRRMRNSTKLKEMHIVRYADDFKIFTSSREQAEKIFIATKLWLKDRLQLDISPEKSKITNLRKKYTEFLGFKLKLHKKRKKLVVESHISDKAKSNITKNLVEQVRKIKHAKQINIAINYYNSMVIGIHSFYQLATHCSKDFSEIAFIVNRGIFNKLKPIRDGVIHKGFIKERYGKSKQVRFLSGTIILPISYVQTKTAMFKKYGVNNYTESGRNIIHRPLTAIDFKVLRYLMNNTYENESVEFYNNKISLYSGQYGKCAITGNYLTIGNMHCHHKLPRKLGIDDSYANLVYLQKEVHILIHAINDETITKYLEFLNLNRTQINKVNKFRKTLELQTI